MKPLFFLLPFDVFVRDTTGLMASLTVKHKTVVLRNTFLNFLSSSVVCKFHKTFLKCLIHAETCGSRCWDLWRFRNWCYLLFLVWWRLGPKGLALSPWKAKRKKVWATSTLWYFLELYGWRNLYVKMTTMMENQVNIQVPHSDCQHSRYRDSLREKLSYLCYWKKTGSSTSAEEANEVDTGCDDNLPVPAEVQEGSSSCHQVDKVSRCTVREAGGAGGACGHEGEEFVNRVSTGVCYDGKNSSFLDKVGCVESQEMYDNRNNFVGTNSPQKINVI